MHCDNKASQLDREAALGENRTPDTASLYERLGCIPQMRNSH